MKNYDITWEISKMTVKDLTTDPRVQMDVRNEIKKICEEANKEENGESFKLLITSFEIENPLHKQRNIKEGKKNE